MALANDNRLRRPSEFRNVLRTAGRRGGTGRRASDALIQLAAAPNGGPDSRIGLSVSKRVGGAVTRNRVKRRLREICRELIVRVVDEGPGDETNWDFVATARPAAAQATYHELRESAATLISKVTARRR